MRIEDVLAVSRRLSLVMEGQDKPYHSLIQEVGQASFAINAPTAGGSALNLQAGDRVEVTVTSEGEQFIFSSRVLGRRGGNPPLYSLSVPPLDSVQRVQMRDYVRVRVALEFRYRVVNEEELPNLAMLSLTNRGITIDISGGGMQAVLEEALPADQLIAVRLELPMRGQAASFLASARVRRCKETTVDRLTRHVAALSFEMIAEKHRDLIIAFLFQRMHDQMRNRK